jgi:hypothetical protein
VVIGNEAATLRILEPLGFRVSHRVDWFRFAGDERGTTDSAKEEAK